MIRLVSFKRDDGLLKFMQRYSVVIYSHSLFIVFFFITAKAYPVNSNSMIICI